jgi:acetylornithine aminotransferase
MARAVALGDRLRGRLRENLAGIAAVSDIRGSGLMLGIELDRPCGALVAAGLDAGILINVTADKVVRLLPPLVMSDAEADELADKLCALLKTFLAG